MTCLKCFRASFSPSSYSEKMRWERVAILKNMASSEGDQLLSGPFHGIMGKIEAAILEIAKK